jgi:hypothetical protein
MLALDSSTGTSSRSESANIPVSETRIKFRLQYRESQESGRRRKKN